MNIRDIFKEIDEYFVSISKDFETNKLELTIGMQKNWITKDIGEITCEKIGENDNGYLVKIKSNDDNTDIITLLSYACTLIIKNKEIDKKREEFNKEIEEKTKKLKEEIESKYKTFNIDDDDLIIYKNKVEEKNDTEIKESLENKLST
jgi:uncharacterized protein YdbL (DUF1318 family)